MNANVLLAVYAQSISVSNSKKYCRKTRVLVKIAPNNIFPTKSLPYRLPKRESFIAVLCTICNAFQLSEFSYFTAAKAARSRSQNNI